MHRVTLAEAVGWAVVGAALAWVALWVHDRRGEPNK